MGFHAKTRLRVMAHIFQEKEITYSHDKRGRIPSPVRATVIRYRSSYSLLRELLFETFSTNFDRNMARNDRFSLALALEKLEEEFLLAEEEYEVTGHSQTNEPVSVLGISRKDQTEPVSEVSGEELEDQSAETGQLQPLVETLSEEMQPSEHEDVEEQTVVDTSVTSIDNSLEDEQEQDAISKFLSETCGCTLGPNKTPCSRQLSQQTISQTHNNCLQLNRSELDLVIMAQLNALRTNVVDKPYNYRGKSETFRPFTKFFLHGIQICRKTFCFVHTVGRERVENLCLAVDTDGVALRIHGNKKYPRHNQISYTEVARVRDFVRNMADVHGLPLPGRLPNQEDKVLLLPSNMPKSAIYRDYKDACAKIPVPPVGQSTFYNLWSTLLPSIGTMKPSSDLCFECQQNISRIIRSAHLSEDEKSDRLRLAETHLHLAKTERDWYNWQIAECKDFEDDHSRPRMMHYSFDYAQQVHFPNDPQQPGPAYSLSARKCQIFGVACEPLGKQVNYLIDEGEVIGKGANATVSLLHHFLNVHGQKEEHLMLHADNCVGQNKNNCLIHYLLYLVLMGYKKTVVLSFMLSGHTKFAPDRHFGLIKKLYRRTRVDTIECIARVVRQSSIIGGNIPQLITNSTGDTLVHFHDWSQFLLKYFKTIPNITSFHVFRFDQHHPGTVFVREHSRSPEKQFTILKGESPTSSDHPNQLLSKGLDLARQWYLYEKIRPFCSTNLSADITCPKPPQQKPTLSEPSVGISSNSTSENSAGTKRRLCSMCKEEGHTKRTCPNAIK